MLQNSTTELMIFIAEGHAEMQKKDACLTYKFLKYLIQKIPKENKLLHICSWSL